MANRRRGLIIVLLVLVLVAGGFAVWRHPAVQDGLLARADLVALSNRVSDHPEDWRAQYWYGRRLAETGDLQVAEVALRTALGSKPDYLPGIAELGKVLLAQGRVEEAFQLLRMAVGRDPKNVDARIALALLYRNEGAYHRSAEEATEALRQEPGNVRALYELAASQALMQQYQKAEETLRTAVQKAPTDVPSLLGLSRVLHQQGKLPEAEEFARRAEKQQPGNPDALILLARISAVKEPVDRNREEALALLRKVREQSGPRLDVAWVTAQILMDQGRWREALPELLAVTQAKRDNTQAYFLLARAYRQLGRIQESKQAEAVFRKRDAYDQQVKALNLKIDAAPDDAKLRFELADLHVAMDRSDLAIAAYRAGLQRDPENAPARKKLTDLLRKAAQQ